MHARRTAGRWSAFAAALGLLLSLPGSGVFAANPSSGTITPAGAPVEWDGEGLVPTDTDEFALTVGGTLAAWTGKQVRISITWISPSTDYDLKVYKGTSSDPVARESGQGATTFESVIIAPAESGLGLYTVVAEYFAATAADQYHGEARVETAPPVVPPPPGGGNPRYQNYVAPPALGDSAGEPTLGVNTETGNVMFIAGLQTLRASFNDCSSPARDTWVDRSAPNTSLASLDPILWTSPAFMSGATETCRTFVSQLAVKSSNMAYTDDDGEAWTPSQGSGINSGVDHQMMGGGPFAAPLTRDPNGALFPWAVYYCAQDVADANCALSLDGGQSFGPAVPIYTADECGGLHGHLKVAPNDGAAYVPNKRCPGYGDRQAVVVSTDNGTTWDVRPVTDSTFGRWDPSIDIGAAGRLYFGYSNATGHAMVSVSSNHGTSWSPSVDVGAAFGLQDIAFPAMVAGDNNRAAFAFLGTTSAAGNQADAIWHLFIATTFNGGGSWTTVDATPGDPVQRGTVCSSGLGCGNDRNMLDFMDATIDAEGRVLVAYADGCIDACVLAPPNTFSAKATIARQSGGKRLLGSFDPVEPAKPEAPRVDASRDAEAVHLVWPEPDNGGSPITGYKVYRATAAGGPFTLLTPTAITEPKYDDDSADPTIEYYYRVTAINAQGEGASCRIKVDTDLTVLQTPCDPPGITVLQDGNDDWTLPIYAADPMRDQYDIRHISVGEPFFGAGVNKLVFTLKVDDLSGTLSPSTQWPIYFTLPNGTGRYVQMQTNASGVASFKYGTVPVDNTQADGYGTPAAPTGDLDAGSGYGPDGTITMIISNSLLDGPAPGDQSPHAGQNLTRFLSRISVGGPTPDNAPDGLAPQGTYSVVGNAFCRPNNAPTAVLAVNPQQGEAPLLVHLNGTGSTDPDGDTITKYRFNFGDGSPLVTQTNDATVDHTYAEPGEYRAILSVRDGRGLWSSNTSFKKIEVEDEDAGPPPSLTINDVKKLEGDSGTTAFVFTVSRSGDTDAPSAVRYHTESGTAKLPEDYVPIQNATLSFGGGATTRTITVQVIGDGKRAGNDTFFVVLTDPTNATIADARGKGTILNDDPYLVVENGSITEPGSGTVVVKVKVVLSHVESGAVTVHWRTRNGSAQAGQDYVGVVDRTLTFAAGETVMYARVTVKADSLNEANETFFVDLFNASNAFIRDDTARVTIRD
ncbi:MAG: hypothetical protein QOH61_916 [Chloroflexota bacterium]|nr:hypothetical protein [Chloroflexota bacterium]